MDMRQYWGIPGLPEHSSGLTEKETNRKSEKGGEGKKREFYYKVYPNNFSTATALSDGTLRRYSIGVSTKLISLLQKFLHGKENVTKEKWWGYCVLSGGIGSYVFLAFMSQPFWKMHQSNCRTRGTEFGHTKSWPSSKPQWRGWRGSCCT